MIKDNIDNKTIKRVVAERSHVVAFYIKLFLFLLSKKNLMYMTFVYTSCRALQSYMG